MPDKHLILALFWLAMLVLALSDLLPGMTIHEPWMVAFVAWAFGVQGTLWGETDAG